MFAIIETGGKQYKVSPGEKIKIERIKAELGSDFVFDKVLLTSSDENTKIGTPYVNGAVVQSKVIRQARHKKVIVFRYHSKNRYRKKKGHRQEFTEVEIREIK